jgi:ureidoglycolate lyase
MSFPNCTWPAMTRPVLPLHPLTRESFAPFGWALGVVGPGVAPASQGATYTSPATDFWREHLFDTGAGGATDVLWVTYRSDERAVAGLEKHLLTQQALMPLNGAIVQVVACSGADGLPDPTSLTAFQVLPGQGLCMAPQCWHTTRVLTPVDVHCVMLSRPSTTVDLVHALQQGHAPIESAFAAIPPHQLAP